VSGLPKSLKFGETTMIYWSSESTFRKFVLNYPKNNEKYKLNKRKNVASENLRIRKVMAHEELFNVRGFNVRVFGNFAKIIDQLWVYWEFFD